MDGPASTESSGGRADIWGAVLQDEYDGHDVRFVVEREDGDRQSDRAAYYLAPWDEWLDCERAVCRHARGHVLDLGCGAGRVAIHLQEQGLKVVGVERSPGALKVARLRGLQRTIRAGTEGPWPRAFFDTALLLGNNAGIAGSCDGTVRLLARLRRRMGRRGRVLFSTRNPDAPALAQDRLYQKRLEAGGRYRGEYRYRLAYEGEESPWFGMVLFDPDTLGSLARRAGWRLRTCYACGPAELGFYAGRLDAD